MENDAVSRNDDVLEKKGHKAWYRFFTDNSIIVVLAALFFVFFFSIPIFRTPRNLTNILLESSVTAIITIGMTFVIIAKEIDLSVGSILCFCGMVYASLSVTGVNVVLGFIIVLGVGFIIGAINGVATVWLRIPSFIVTLAMMTIARGAALLWRNGESIRGMTSNYLWFGQKNLFGMPVPVFLLLVVGVFGFVLLRFTKFGLYTYAIGGSNEAARLAGIRVKLIKILIFAFTGTCAALSGVITTSRLGIGSPITGNGKELDAIAAVVLGGASLNGGKGSVIGSLAGALTVTMLGNGMTLLRISSYWQRVLIGIVIVAALAFQRDSGLMSLLKREK